MYAGADIKLNQRTQNQHIQGILMIKITDKVNDRTKLAHVNDWENQRKPTFYK